MDLKFTQSILSLRGKETGQKWLDNLPSEIKSYEEKWKLKSLGEFSELSINYVEKAKTESGQDVVLKIGFPYDEVFLYEIKTLEAYRGKGAVKILEKDMQNFVILLERCMPGNSLHILNNEEEEIKIFAEVCKKIWKKAGEVSGFINLSGESKYFDWYFDNLEKCKDSLPEDLVIKAKEKFDELIATPGEQYLLHADLHHDNILKSERGWLCIDPKGIIGEREYEPSVYVINPFNRFRENEDLVSKEFFAERIDLISKALDLNRERVVAWGYIKQMLSLIWTLQDYGTDDKIGLKKAKELEKLI